MGKGITNGDSLVGKCVRVGPCITSAENKRRFLFVERYRIYNCTAKVTGKQMRVWHKNMC